MFCCCILSFFLWGNCFRVKVMVRLVFQLRMARFARATPRCKGGAILS